jgi:hypothetical protein
MLVFPAWSPVDRRAGLSRGGAGRRQRGQRRALGARRGSPWPAARERRERAARGRHAAGCRQEWRAERRDGSRQARFALRHGPLSADGSTDAAPAARTGWRFAVGSGRWRSGLPPRLSFWSGRSELRLRWGASGRETRPRLAIRTRCSTPGAARGGPPYAAPGAARPAARAQDILAGIVSATVGALGPGHDYSPPPAVRARRSRFAAPAARAVRGRRPAGTVARWRGVGVCLRPVRTCGGARRSGDATPAGGFGTVASARYRLCEISPVSVAS